MVALVQGKQATAVERDRRIHDDTVRAAERRQDRIEQVYIELLLALRDEEQVRTEDEDAWLTARLDAHGSLDVAIAYIEWKSARREYLRANALWRSTHSGDPDRLDEESGVVLSNATHEAQQAQIAAGVKMTELRNLVRTLVRTELRTAEVEPTR